MIKEKHYDLILIIMKTFGFGLCRAFITRLMSLGLIFKQRGAGRGQGACEEKGSYVNFIARR